MNLPLYKCADCGFASSLDEDFVELPENEPTYLCAHCLENAIGLQWRLDLNLMEY